MKPRGTLHIWEIYNPDDHSQITWRWTLSAAKFTVYGERLYNTKQLCKKAAINNTKNLGVNITRIVQTTRSNIDFIA